MKKIVLTGGGTAGHVSPNLALIPHLKAAGYDISYIGTEKGIELVGPRYFGVDTDYIPLEERCKGGH